VEDGHGKALAAAAAMWPTPGAQVSNDGESPETWQARADALKAKGYNGNGAGMPLAIASQLWPGPCWPTPSARDWKSGEASTETLEGNARPLNEVATMLWATPTSHDRTHTPRDVDHGAQLANQVNLWATPRAEERVQYNSGDNYVALSLQVQGFHPSRPDQTTPPDGRASLPADQTSPRQLNARFVEWLQGLTPGHTCVCAREPTDSERWETPWSLSKPRLPSECSTKG
jgi:hypothetical protein